MKKRIIIVGDSFSLGVGADWPPFENVHPLAPPIGDTWLNNWRQITADYFTDFKLQVEQNIKENKSILDSMSALQQMYRIWQDSVYEADFYSQMKEIDPDCNPTSEEIKPGIMHKREDLEYYPHTWSNVLNSLLPDIDVINLSVGGASMASVVSSLSIFVNSNSDHNNYETLVFFQAPEPSRKHVVTTDVPPAVNKEQCTDFNYKLEHLIDYNVSGPGKLHIVDSHHNFKEHNLAYAEKDLFVGEWFQDIFNMQQICKANDFYMAWCTAQIPIRQVMENKDNMFPNVLGLDIRYDRNPFNLDRFFASMVILNRKLGMNYVDHGNIFSGCMHFSGEVQKHFAEYMANSLISNEEFWWQK